jgi:hypothetical protein
MLSSLVPAWQLQGRQHHWSHWEGHQHDSPVIHQWRVSECAVTAIATPITTAATTTASTAAIVVAVVVVLAAVSVAINLAAAIATTTITTATFSTAAFH